MKDACQYPPQTAAPQAPAVPLANQDVPSGLGIMVGSPPAPENRVTKANAMSPRFLRWSALNTSSVLNTTRVFSGPQSQPLPQGTALDVDALTVTLPGSGERVSMDAFYRLSGVDALVVLHRGSLVFERYFGDMRASSLHAAFSCTKSMVGTLVAMLAHEGRLDLSQPASAYVPELVASGAGHATLQQLLDMRANFQSEPSRRANEVDLGFLQALDLVARPPGYAGPDGVYEVVMAVKASAEHGTGPVRYENICTDTLGWVLTRTTGQSMAQLFSERLWMPMGAERDGDFALDSRKTPWASGGLNCTARDAARFGEMMRQGGTANGQRVVPAEVVADICRGGDRESFAQSVPARFRPCGSYRNQWWINHDAYGSYNCAGQFGQRIWVAPAAETVVVQFSVDPDPSNSREPLRQAAYRTIAAALCER